MKYERIHQIFHTTNSIFRPAQLSEQNTNCEKSEDAWINELSPYKILNNNRNITN